MTDVEWGDVAMPTGGQLMYTDRLSFRIPAELSQRVRHEAANRQLTLADLLRDILDQAVPPKT